MGGGSTSKGVVGVSCMRSSCLDRVDVGLPVICQALLDCVPGLRRAKFLLFLLGMEGKMSQTDSAQEPIDLARSRTRHQSRALVGVSVVV